MQKPQKNMRFNALQGVLTAALGYLGIIIASSVLVVVGLLIYFYEHGIDLTSGITIEQITLTVASQRWVFFTGLFLNQAAYLAAGFGMGAYCKVDVIKTCGLNKKPSLRNVLLCVAISLVSLYLLSAAGSLFGYGLQHIGYQPQGLGYEFKGAGDFILGFLIIACLAPLGEELVYRGAMQNGLMQGKSKNRCVILSATAFTLMHANPEQTAYQFLLGLALGFVMLKTQNLWLPIIIHAINNFIALLFEYVPALYNTVYEPIFELHPLLLWVILLIMTALGATVIYILIRLMKAPAEQNDTQTDTQVQVGGLPDTTKNRIATTIYIMLLVVCAFGWLTTFFSRLA